MENPVSECLPCCPGGTDCGSVHRLVIVLVGLFGLQSVVFLQVKIKENQVEMFILKTSELLQATLFLLGELKC